MTPIQPNNDVAAPRPPASSPTPQSSEILIEAGRPGGQYWRDLWRYRELMGFLAWRDILVRYKHTVIGIAWALIRPLVTMLVFVLIFGVLARLDTVGDVPYPLLVLAGMLPWQFFAGTLSDCGGSMLSNANLITKVYFPRLVVPASVAVVNLVDFAVSGLLLIGMMAWYGWWPSWRILALPAFVALALLAALGPGIWLAALTVKFRDVRYVVPFLVQLSLYVSPVGYGTHIVPEQWRLLYSLNPMVGVIDGFRWSLFGSEVGVDLAGLLLSCFVIALIFVTGVRYFRMTERYFADII